MTHHLQIQGTDATDATDATDDTVAPTVPAGTADRLRRLYSVRFAFAAVWAVLFAVTASTLGPVSIGLLVLYPLFDLAAAVVDSRSSGAARSRGPLRVNVALSLVATLALVVAASSGIPAVLGVWGVWAIAAGVVQVVVAIRRTRLDGQRAMILSGSISVFAGLGFVLMSTELGPSLAGLAGYAGLGAVFFLVSALRLRRPAPTST